MTKQIKTTNVIRAKLPRGWSDHSLENPDGPATFLRDISSEPSVLQVSFALQKAGEIPNPSREDLVKLANKTGEDMLLGNLIETSSGKCAFGIFGTAIFKSKQNPRTQIWYLSDGSNFILATHICVGDPQAEEVAEAQRIVSNLYISKRPFWKRR